MNVLDKILEEIEERVDFRKRLVKYEKRRGTITDVCRNEGALEELDIIAAIIRSYMNEVKNDGWIPVEEILPEEDSFEHIISRSDGIVITGISYGYARDEDKEPCFYKYDDECWNCYKYHDVVAWQPLPEPYKPKEKDDE